MKGPSTLIFLILIIASEVSCSHNDLDNTIVIDYDGLSSSEIKQFQSTLKPVVLHDGGHSDYLLSSIDKIIFTDEGYFILDAIQRKIVVFDNAGNPLRCIKKIGRAKQEYLRISDFDIDCNSDIVILDGQSDNLIRYRKDGSFIQKSHLRDEANAFSFFGDSNNLIFNISPWSKGKCSGRQLLITDNKLNRISDYLPYMEGLDSSFSFFSIPFSTDGSRVVYFQPASDEIYLIDIDSIAISRIYMNFGTHSVPMKCWSNIERNMDAFNSGTFITNVAYSDGEIIICSVRDCGEVHDVIIDINSGTIYRDFDKELTLRMVSSGKIFFQDLNSQDNNIIYETSVSDVKNLIRNQECISLSIK